MFAALREDPIESECFDPSDMGFNTQKLANVSLGLMVTYVGITGVLRAAAKPFWCDEVITIGLARLQRLSAIRGALANAADSHPPPFYLLEAAAARLPFNELVTFRLPSIAAFCVLLLCTFLYIRRASRAEYALICTAIPLVSVLFYPFAVEARGYSLMAGCTALAMICYQRADKLLWCLLLALSLAAAVDSHYYAIFAVFPFGLAELALLLRERRVRAGVWIALISSLLPLIVYWHLLEAIKKTYSSHYHGHLSVMEILKSYGFLFDLPPTPGIGFAAAALVAILIFGFTIRGRVADADKIPFHEHALALGFITLPFAMFFILKLSHGGFADRYTIVTALSFPLAARYVLQVMDRRVIYVFCALLLVSLGAQEASFWQREHAMFGKKLAPAEGFERFVVTAQHPDLPVVVSDAIAYLPLAYYASPEVKRRLVFLADPQTAITYTGSDNADKCVSALRPYLSLQVYDFKNFVGTHSDFLLYSDGVGIWDWLPTRMTHDGFDLQVATMDMEKRIYLVHAKR